MAEIGLWFKDIIAQVTILDAIDVLVVAFFSIPANKTYQPD